MPPLDDFARNPLRSLGGDIISSAGGSCLHSPGRAEIAATHTKCRSGVGRIEIPRTGDVPRPCVISTPDRAPMWGNLADVLSRFLPELRDVLFLSFALHDPNRLEAMLVGAGFRDVRVERTAREGSFESFTDYWEPVEAGVGSMPQAYLRLAAADRQAVREAVRSRLSRFESNGQLRMSVEMLIGSGRA